MIPAGVNDYLPYRPRPGVALFSVFPQAGNATHRSTSVPIGILQKLEQGSDYSRSAASSANFDRSPLVNLMCAARGWPFIRLWQ